MKSGYVNAFETVEVLFVADVLKLTIAGSS
jgi:hypothetical protein